MGSGKRVEGEPLADWAACYGPPPQLTYSDWYSLYLNIPRQIHRRAYWDSAAVGVGNGAKIAPDDWVYDAYESKAEADLCLSRDRELLLIQSLRQSRSA